MDSVIPLLVEAARAGLRAHVEGTSLVVRGPRSAEETARRLLDRKADLIAALSDTEATRLQAALWIFDAQVSEEEEADR